VTAYAIQAGALHENPNSGPDGVGVQADIAYTLEARAEVQAVCGIAAPNPRHANDNTPNAGQPLRFLSVCSGIEAASVAWHPLGWRAVAFSEIEKFPSAVLARHYPDVSNLGDFTKIDTTKLGQVDILAGGTPCQAFSVAGLRQGLDDARGNLTLKFVELAHELAGYGKTDGNGLRNVVWENVVGVLSDKGNAFGCFLAGLVGADDAVIPSEKPADGKSNKYWKWRKGGRYAVLDDDGEETGEYEVREPWHAISWPSHGMVSGPKGRAAWAVKDAQFFGVAQRRRRVLVVADFGNGSDPAAVLFEPEGVFRHPPSRGEAGKDVAPTISARTKGGGGLGTDFDLDGGLRVDWPAEVCPTLDAHYGDKMGLENQHVFNQKAGKFMQSGFMAVAFNAETQADQLPGFGHDTDVNDGLTVSQRAAVAITAKTVAIRGRDGGATAELGGDVATALRASQGGGDKPHVLAFADVGPTLKRDYGKGYGDGEMDGGGLVGQTITSAVRRLTPRECERLQGFQWQCSPDYPGAWQDDAGRWWSPDYTAIPWRGKPAEDCPDGPRYKALGNSWAVPKFTWLGRRITQFMPQVADNDNHTSTPISANRSHA